MVQHLIITKTNKHFVDNDLSTCQKKRRNWAIWPGLFAVIIAL